MRLWRRTQKPTVHEELIELLKVPNSDIRYLILGVARASVRDYIEEYLESDTAQLLIRRGVAEFVTEQSLDRLLSSQNFWEKTQARIAEFVDNRLEKSAQRYIKQYLDSLDFETLDSKPQE
jgi:hypothetical protein